jgi:hypothetical protein
MGGDQAGGDAVEALAPVPRRQGLEIAAEAHQGDHGGGTPGAADGVGEADLLRLGDGKTLFAVRLAGEVHVEGQHAEQQPGTVIDEMVEEPIALIEVGVAGGGRRRGRSEARMRLQAYHLFGGRQSGIAWLTILARQRRRNAGVLHGRSLWPHIHRRRGRRSEQRRLPARILPVASV